MSQAGTIDIENANPTVPTSFTTDDANSAVPIANNLEIIGNTVAANVLNKPLKTTSSGKTVTVNVQVGKARTGAPLDKNDAGIVSFDDTDFVVDTNGYVTLVGGSVVEKFTVQNATAPGVNPVLPSAAGLVTINGAAVANHNIVLESHSRALNEYNIEVQYAGSSVAADAIKSGVAHFDSAAFTVVGSNGFVQLIGGGVAIQTINADSGAASGTTVNLYAKTNYDNGSSVSTIGDNTSTLNVKLRDAIDNILIGRAAGNATLTGSNNVGTGYLALAALTTGSYNVVSGESCGLSLTTGSYNTYIGYQAGYLCQTGSYSVAMGYQALYRSTVGSNIGIGVNALKESTTGLQNTAIGNNAGANAGICNNNTLIGYDCGAAIGSSDSNTAVGMQSLQTLNAGNYNTCVGRLSLTSLVAGSYNLALGYNAGSSLTTSDSSNILIANTGVLGESNVMRIGTTGSGNNQVNKTYLAAANVTVAGPLLNIASTEQVGTLAEGTAGQVLTSAGAGASPVWAANATTDYHVARYIVSAGGATDGANYTTIASAITDAVAATGVQTIFIQPGIYTENLTLPANINLSAFNCDAQTPNVTILGKITCTDAGSRSISGIRLETNGDYLLECSGAGAQTVNVFNCFLNCSDFSAVNNTNSNAASIIHIFYSLGNLATTGIKYFVMSGTGKIKVRYSQLLNPGVSTTSSTISNGALTFEYSFFNNQITTSGTGQIGFYCCTTELNDLTAVIHGSSTEASSRYSRINTGTATAITIAVSTTFALQYSQIFSSNTNVVSGSGTLKYGQVVFESSDKLSSAIQIPSVVSNPAVTIVSPSSYPYTTVPQDALILVDTSVARTITPLASPTTGQRHMIKDSVGSAATNNITITPSGKNVDGAASTVINVAYGSITIIYNGTEWSIV